MTYEKASSEIGKYRLLEFLGGGMSQVFQAQDTVLGRTVAVKILTDEGCSQPDAKARFLAEARLASRLTHDNILGIYDFGEDDEHRPFMVMEYLEGRDLRQAIREGTAGDVPARLRIALQVASALRYIHSRGVIHRDVKPENVYLTTTGAVKVMDFGIAKTAGLGMTRVGYVLGTPYYMAPEQVLGKELAPQADVYAFGVLLFELLTGVKPITGNTVERIFYVILNEPLDLTPLATSGAPSAVCKLVAQCTAKDPAARPQGFEPICELLESLTTPPTVAATSIDEHAVHDTRAGSRRTLLTAAAYIAGMAALLGALLGLASRGYQRVERELNAAGTAVLAAGIADDGLLSLEGLKQLHSLRNYAASLSGRRRDSLPLSYRAAALLWGDLSASAERLYWQRFRTFLIAPAQAQVAQFLRRLPASGGPSYAEVFDALKLYEISTTHPDKNDPQFLAAALLRWWEAGANPGSDREEAARREFEAYAQAFRPRPAEGDDSLVSGARRYLNRFADSDRVYTLLLGDAEHHATAWNFNRQFPGSDEVLKETYEVPGAFTKAGWEFVKDALAHGERYFAGDAWVTGKDGSASAENAHMAASLMARYQADYIQAWRRYLENGWLVRFSSVEDAAGKLDLLAGDHSPIALWLAGAAQNAAVDDAAIAVGLRPVEDAISLGPVYRDLLIRLAAAVRQSAGQSNVNDPTPEILEAVHRLESSLHHDVEGHADAQVARMLEGPATVTRMWLRAGGASQWNTIGARLGGQLKPLLAKYPFVRTASDQASVEEIAAVFQPRVGSLWKLCDSSLQKLITRQGSHFAAHAGSELNVNPAFLAFLDRAAALSQSLFGEPDGQMRVRYTLRPVIPPDVDFVKITLDGQSATFHANTPAKAFIWPGTGAADMRVTVRYKNKTEYNWSKQGTVWAIFLFLDQARRHQGAQREIPLAESVSMWFEIGASSAVFDAGCFSGLNYVAEIVKP